MAKQRSKTRRRKTKASYILQSERYNRQRQHTKARDLLLKLEAMYPEDTEIYYNLGMTYVYTEEYEKGILYLEKAVAADPSILEAHSHLGHAYVTQHRYEEAVALLTPSLNAEENKHKDACHYVLGRAYIGLDEYEKALHHFEEVQKIGPPKTVNLDFYIAQTHSLIGNYDISAAYFEKSLKKHPNDPTVLAGLAILHLRLEKLEEAETCIRDAFLLDPTCESAHHVLELLEEAQAEQAKKNSEENTAESSETLET